MSGRNTYAWRYWEGSNLMVAVVLPILAIIALWDYPRVYQRIQPLGIDIDILLSYTFNLFAIGLGALVSLFALLASRPTEFLSRIRGTDTFRRLISNIKITMLFCAFVIFANFVFGILKLTPDATLTIATVAFVTWSTVALATGAFFLKTVRLIFLALT